MTSTSVLENIEKYIPLVGDVNIKTPLAYKASRGAVKVVNAAQMAVAEAYITDLKCLMLYCDRFSIPSCPSCSNIFPLF